MLGAFAAPGASEAAGAPGALGTSGGAASAAGLVHAGESAIENAKMTGNLERMPDTIAPSAPLDKG
jgi:hypothetical protein